MRHSHECELLNHRQHDSHSYGRPDPAGQTSGRRIASKISVPEGYQPSSIADHSAYKRDGTRQHRSSDDRWDGHVDLSNGRHGSRSRALHAGQSQRHNERSGNSDMSSNHSDISDSSSSGLKDRR